MRKIIIVLILLIYLGSCIKQSEPVFKNKITPDQIPIINVDNIGFKSEYLDSFITNVHYVKPEATKNSLVGNYDKILAYGDTIFILDKSTSQQCIFAFNYNGDFLFKIDARGRGPGEYRNLSDFYVDYKSGHIGILDFSKVLKYNFNGDFISSLDLKNHNVVRLHYKNNRLFAYKKPYCSTNKCYSFAVFDLEGNLLYEDYPLEKDLLHFPYSKTNYFSKNTKGIYLNMLNSDTIYRVTENGLYPEFALDFGKCRMPKNELKKLFAKPTTFSLNYFFDKDYVMFGLSKFIITDNYMLMQYNIKTKGYSLLYSLNTGKAKRFSSWYPSEKYLPFSNIRTMGNQFYGTLSTESAIWIKGRDEYLGINDVSKKFSKQRYEKYNFVKNTKIEDNDIIVFFNHKDF